MPTPWKRSPEELHKTYIANTEAFYKVAGRGLAQELMDTFAQMRQDGTMQEIVGRYLEHPESYLEVECLEQ